MFFFKVYVAHSFCDKFYTYSFADDLPIFSLVQVEFGSKKCIAIVIDIDRDRDSEKDKIKEILIKYNYILPQEKWAFIRKFAEYYYLTIGSILLMVFPAIAFQKGVPLWLNYEGKIVSLFYLLKRIPLKDIKKLQKANYLPNPQINSHVLTQDQEEALNFLIQSKRTCLLEGVTGSGKTIVAIHALKNYKGKILILVPEINLTSHWEAAIKKSLGIEPLIFHSKILNSLKKTFFNWAISNDYGIVIGTRSALLLPYQNLDYIVVDEEHSVFYRQDVYPYYNARDMAILLGQQITAKVLLLSATPSLETIVNIQKGKYEHVKLTRTPKYGLAEVKYTKGSSSNIIAPLILNKVEEIFKNKHQVLFFLNRKGYAPYCVCNECKQILVCKVCDTAFTFFLGYQIICGKCGQKSILPKTCFMCKKLTTWSFFGVGVQKVHQFLSNHFPNQKFEILTSDSENLEDQFEKIVKQDVDGIIATQIVAQGHDFKNIALVVVIDADMGLISTDFRAMERIYQLWQQIRGRSGRHDVKGEMILQYFKEDNKFLELFQRKDVIQFLLQERFDEKWPPFSKCAFIKFKGKDQEKLTEQMNKVKLSEFEFVEIFGPLFGGQINRVFEFRFLVRGLHYSNFRSALHWFKTNFKCEIEVDPY